MLIHVLPLFVIDMLGDEIKGGLVKLLKKQHRKFQVEFGSNSKPVGQNIEDLFSSQTPTKKRKQKEKTDKIAEDSNTTRQDLSQKGKNKKLKPAMATTSMDNSSSKKHASEGASTSGSVAFMNGSGKRKPPGFLSDKKPQETKISRVLLRCFWGI
jgi:hypothetical protein